MIDLDIPTTSPPETDTLLHWLQTDLTPSTTPTQLNTTSGAITAFLLTPSSSNTSAIAPYIGPNPPARIPLSHRYTQILVDTSGGALSAEGTGVLTEAAGTRRGFDAEAVVRNCFSYLLHILSLENALIICSLSFLFYLFLYISLAGWLNRRDHVALGWIRLKKLGGVER
jgi:phosphatidylethanolamine-binding protein (PEBP) family uncharacterized protein